MNYRECLDYLNRLGDQVAVAKFGLDNIRTLLGALGNPHRRFPSVLIAGTNGKGSVASFLSSIFTSAGHKTGLYTSPHLISVDERISVNGRRISADSFAACISRTVDAIQALALPYHPTFFETVTATAFLSFAEAGADIAVVEVGMGGRNDSTNVLEPTLSVITPISIDHQQYLGQSFKEIAFQKAGIIHRRGTAISAGQLLEVRSVLEEEAARQEAELRFVDEGRAHVTGSEGGRYHFSLDGMQFELNLHGRHQVGNAVLAISATEILQEKGFPFTRSAITDGINRASIPGRIQKIGECPAVFLDGAHNDEALEKLADFVEEHTRRPRSLVFGMMSDKRISTSVRRLTTCFDSIYLTRTSSKRAATASNLARLFPTGTWVDDPLEALTLARQHSVTVVVTGSLYLVGEVLASSS